MNKPLVNPNFPVTHLQFPPIQIIVVFQVQPLGRMKSSIGCRKKQGDLYQNYEESICHKQQRADNGRSQHAIDLRWKHDCFLLVAGIISIALDLTAQGKQSVTILVAS